jgi:hypothetical protein
MNLEEFNEWLLPAAGIVFRFQPADAAAARGVLRCSILNLPSPRPIVAGRTSKRIRLHLCVRKFASGRSFSFNNFPRMTGCLGLGSMEVLEVRFQVSPGAGEAWESRDSRNVREYRTGADEVLALECPLGSLLIAIFMMAMTRCKSDRSGMTFSRA